MSDVSKTSFYLDMENLPAQAFAAWDTAGLLLIELAKIHGAGPWKDEMKNAILARYTDMDGKGDAKAVGFDKPNAEASARAIVESIFDRVAFADELNN